MVSLVAAVLLAASPAPTTPSLLSPESGRHLSARLLVAQAPPEAPTDAPTPPPEPPVDPELDARIRELSRQVALGCPRLEQWAWGCSSPASSPAPRRPRSTAPGVRS